MCLKCMGGKGRARIQAGSNLPLEYQSVLMSPCPPKIAVGLEKGKNKFKNENFLLARPCLEDGGKANSGICCGGSELPGALMC